MIAQHSAHRHMHTLMPQFRAGNCQCHKEQAGISLRQHSIGNVTAAE